MKTKEQIIIDAFRKIGIPGDGDVLTSYQMDVGISALDGVVKFFVAKHGLPLWKTEDLVFTMDNFTDNMVTIGPTGTIVTSTPVVKIKGAWRVDLTDATKPLQVALQIKERERFNTIPNYLQSGPPVFVYPEYKSTVLNLYIWPVPDTYWDAGGSVKLTTLSELNVYSDDETELDIPAYWEDPIIYTLACRLAPEYGVSQSERTALMLETKELVKDAEGFDSEVGSIFIRPTKNGLY